MNRQRLVYELGSASVRLLEQEYQIEELKKLVAQLEDEKKSASKPAKESVK